MLIISVILLILYLVSLKLIRDSLLKKIMDFLVLLYGIQIILAIWDPYNYYQMSLSSVIMFNVQIVCLILGVLFYEKKHGRFIFPTIQFRWPRVNINTFMLIIITILFLYSLYNYNRMQSFLLTMATSSHEGREYYYTMFFPSYTLRIIDYFLTSFKYVAYTISLTLLFRNGLKLSLKEKYFIILTVLIYILLLLTAQSRLDIFVFVFMLMLFAYIASTYDKVKFKKKILPFILVTSVGIVILFLSVTFLRANLTNDSFNLDLVDQLIIEPFATYFYVPILAFDYAKDTMLNYDFPLCGLCTFSCIVDTILLPFTLIDRSIGSLSMNTFLGSTIGTGMYFPSGEHWMAMYTGCANYYLDFWYFGFVIFPFLHGCLLSKVVYLFRTRLIPFLLLPFLFYISFRHATSLGIQSIETIFFIIWVLLIVKNKSVSYK